MSRRTTTIPGGPNATPAGPTVHWSSWCRIAGAASTTGSIVTYVELVGPLAGDLLDAGGAGAVHRRLDDREDGALQGRREQDLAPAAVLVGGVRGVVVAL